MDLEFGFHLLSASLSHGLHSCCKMCCEIYYEHFRKHFISPDLANDCGRQLYLFIY